MRFEVVRDQVRTLLTSGAFDAAIAAESVLRSYLENLPSGRDQGMGYELLGQLLRMQGRLKDALQMFDAANPLLTEPRDRLTLLNGWASAIVASRRTSLCMGVASELQMLLTDHAGELADIAAWGYVSLCDLALLLRNNQAAMQHGRDAVRLAVLAGAARAEAYRALALACEAAGDLPGAQENLEEAMVFMRNGHCLMEARAHHGRIAAQLGDVATAVRDLHYAVELPDLRDRLVLAVVMSAIADVGAIDPQAAVRCTRILAAHLANGAGDVLAAGGGGDNAQVAGGGSRGAGSGVDCDTGVGMGRGRHHVRDDLAPVQRITKT